MMIKEYNQSIQWKCMHMERADLIWKKEETKCNSLIKQCQKWLTLMV